jgi:ribosomal protein L40E
MSARATHCVRCGAELPAAAPAYAGAATTGSDAAYCPACGSPQLRITEEEIALAAAALAGVPVSRPIGGREIIWPNAIAAAMTCGFGMGILSSYVVGPLNNLVFIWAVTGAVCAVALYERRAPGARLSAGIGARIGALSGILAGAVAAMLTALVMVMERFLFGQGHVVDAFVAELLKEMTQMPAQLVPMGDKNPFLLMVQTPAGHAVLLLSWVAGTMVWLLVFSLLGGAAAGRFFAFRRRMQGVAR